jgi:hypothetical protein
MTEPTNQQTDKLKTALADAKKAARAIVKAIEANDVQRLDYHRKDAIAQLEFALTSLRAAG